MATFRACSPKAVALALLVALSFPVPGFSQTPRTFGSGYAGTLPKEARDEAGTYFHRRETLRPLLDLMPTDPSTTVGSFRNLFSRLRLPASQRPFRPTTSPCMKEFPCA